MRLGKTEQKIFAHSAILKVVMIPLEKIERMRIEREEVPIGSHQRQPGRGTVEPRQKDQGLQNERTAGFESQLCYLLDTIEAAGSTKSWFEPAK